MIHSATKGSSTGNYGHSRSGCRVLVAVAIVLAVGAIAVGIRLATLDRARHVSMKEQHEEPAVAVEGADPSEKPSEGPQYADLHGRRTYDGFIPTMSPSLSPDCRQLVYMDPTEGHGDIFLMDLENGTRRRLVGGPNVEREPRFTHDGASVLFLGEEGAFRHVYVVDLITKKVSQVTSGNTVDDIVALSPTGNRALVLRRAIVPGWENEPWIPLYECDYKQETEVDLQIKAGGVYAAGGRKIVYCDVEHLDRIWVYDRETGLRKRVGVGSVMDGHPTRAEVLISRPDGEIALLDLESENEKPLGKASGAMFLSDEAILTMSYAGGTFALRDLATNHTRNLTVTIPRGVLAPSCEPPKCGRLPLWIQYPEQQDVFLMGILDLKSQKFEEKLRLDMTALRVRPGQK